MDAKVGKAVSYASSRPEGCVVLGWGVLWCEARAMFQVRATSFFTGFAVATGLAMFQLQRNVWGSHHILADEVGSIVVLLGAFFVCVDVGHGML